MSHGHTLLVFTKNAQCRHRYKVPTVTQCTHTRDQLQKNPKVPNDSSAPLGSPQLVLQLFAHDLSQHLFSPNDPTNSHVSSKIQGHFQVGFPEDGRASTSPLLQQENPTTPQEPLQLHSLNLKRSREWQRSDTQNQKQRRIEYPLEHSNGLPHSLKARFHVHTSFSFSQRQNNTFKIDVDRQNPRFFLGRQLPPSSLWCCRSEAPSSLSPASNTASVVSS